MPAIAARSWRRILAHIFVMVASLVGVDAPALAQPVKPSIHILVPPPLQWDNEMLSARPALSQTGSDFTAITGGIAFGMTATDVNAHLPDPAAGINWTSLPPATEFQEDIRYFWTRMDGARELRAGSTSCVGSNSYIAFLFQARGLFRISYRLVPDQTCPRTDAAGSEIFGRYVQISRSIAQSVHYRNGAVEVIDITDPTAGYLTVTRWQSRTK